MTAGRAGAIPIAIREAPEREQVRLAHSREFLDEMRERQVIEICRRHVIVLIEARQRLLLAAADGERAKPEYAIAIDDMTKHLADAPLARLVTKCLAVRGDARRKASNCLRLQLQHRQHIG